MLRLFLRHSLRYFARHKTLTALNVLGIALGVTVFVAVQVVNHSALASFKASVDVVAGRANFQVVGDGVRFDEEVYREVRSYPRLAAATPVVEEVATLPDFPGEYLHVLGVDVFSNAPLRTYQFAAGGNQQAEAIDFVRDPRVIAVTRAWAERLGLRPGDPVRLRTQGGLFEARLGYLLAFDDDVAGADEHVAVMDIASAQQAFGHLGLLSRIDCRLREGVTAEEAADGLRPVLPANLTAGAPDRRGSQIEKMIGAFQLNLTALSLVSLLVGMFLVYNTVAAAVVRRQSEIGLLRALGLSRWQVQGLFLGEALLQGCAGVVLGIGLGVALAGQLIGVVSRTITSLYILLSIRDVLVSPWAVAAAVGLGVGAVLLAAWFPSREAARVSPVEALSLGHLREKSALRTGRWLAMAFALLAASAVLALAARSGGLPPWAGFGSALCCLLGFAFTVPSANRRVAAALSPRPIVARLAFRQFGSSLHRNSVTTAALVTALAMVVGISVMIFSFRSTVEAWLDRSVVADVFIAPAANLLVGTRQTVPAEAIDVVVRTPGIDDFDLYREIKPQFRGRTIKVAAFRFSVNARHNRLQFLGGRDGAATLRAAAAREEVAVSEVFARKFGVKEGGFIELATPQGLRSFRIAGIFVDYTTESGLVIMDLETYRKHWKDLSVNSMALHAADGVSARDLQERLRPALAPLGEFLIYSNQQLRIQVFRIFDQTFAVTYLLQTIGILVSGLGIFLSLFILVGERTRELGILRAVGASAAQVQAAVVIEALLIGAIGAGLGVVAGLALAAILSYVINVAFFGWTIHWATPWRFLGGLPAAVLLASVAAAWWPARLAARLDIASAVKME